MMILSLTAGLAACGLAGEGSQAAAEDAGVQRYAWPLGSSSPEDTVTQIYAEKFADEVDRLSDGKMKIMAVLVNHQYRTGFDFFSYFRNNFGENTVIIIGDDRIRLALAAV